jgi:2-dehydro-3-deoxyphosphooctonate aldolase (KDO 8-P synthase)
MDDRNIMTKTRQVRVGPLTFGAGSPFVLIAGPCVIENETHPLFMAHELKSIAGELCVPFIFKASYDKANRTSGGSFRGPGLEKGLAILEKVKLEAGVPITTDVHETGHVEDVAAVADLLQIPAFLCRQTDLILAAAHSGKAVNIKKGQFLAPWDIVHAVDKARSSGNDNVLVTERGTSFGYNNLVVDFRGFPIIRGEGIPLIFDVTHSLQLPGGAGTASSGQSKFIRELASAGVGAGVDGVFMEVHDNPQKALSDGPNSLHLSDLARILRRLQAIHDAARSVE